MIARYNHKSLAFGIPGLVLQIAGNMAAQRPEASNAVSNGTTAMLLGTVLLMVGLAFYAKAKGRNPAWCLMAFFSFIGLLVLAMLKDMSPKDEPSGS